MPPKIDMSREEAAEREIGVTRVSSGVKILLVVFFLLSLLAIPLIQSTRGFGIQSKGKEAPRSGLWARLASINHHLKTTALAIEKSLEEHSFLTKTFLPPVQTLAFQHLGLGNEKVYVVPDGWLHYRPDVDYVLEAGRASAGEPATKAFAQLHSDLQSRGIRLIVLPVPAKPVIESNPPASHHAAHTQFLAELHRNGIEVFDPTSLLMESRAKSGRAQFLKTDTHWTPEAMETIAEALANKISQTAPPVSFLKKETPVPVKNSGDLAVMLQLQPEASSSLAESVKIHPVRLPNGNPWRPDPSSDVLLLGDSFTNIYSTPDLGWGEGGGLAEHLSLRLGRSVDRIAINAGGSLTVRQSLARNPERLDGKKIVVYQFAVRELTSGDWRPVSIPASTMPAPKAESASILEGVIQEISPLPAPGSVPYKDAVISLHLVEINGDPQAEALVFMRGMKGNVPTKAANLKAGERVSISVVPWESVEDQYGSITRIELDGPAADLDSIYWADSQ
ncbi:MAG: alginate O-acetyltransferase AlgX-related protein [Terrimicrobiaceae bacterium]